MEAAPSNNAITPHSSNRTVAYDDVIAAYSKLTPKQQRFVDCLATGMSQSDAAREACDCSTDKSARVRGTQMMKSPLVRHYMQMVSWQHGVMTATEAAARLSEHARGSLAPFLRIHEDGSFWYNLTSEEAQKSIHLIKKIKSHRQTKRGDVLHEWVEVELHDPQAALRDILKLHGAYQETPNVAVQVNNYWTTIEDKYAGAE